MTRFVSWNVNGLRACSGKGFEEAFKALDADFFCLQETKMQEGQLDLQFEGYELTVIIHCQRYLQGRYSML